MVNVGRGRSVLRSLVVRIAVILLTSVVTFRMYGVLKVQVDLVPLIVIVKCIVRGLLRRLYVVLTECLISTVPPSLLVSIGGYIDGGARPLTCSPASGGRRIRGGQLRLFRCRCRHRRRRCR